MKSYKEIKNYRDKICGGKVSLYTHQSFLANFINPNTPYKGLLIFHGVGTGKTGTFLIGTLQNIDETQSHTQALILSPTRELSEQIKRVCDSLSGYTKLHLIY